MRHCLFSVLFLIVASSPAIGREDALAPPTSQTNILWLSVEDMSPWLPCYGDDTVPTPNIDRLAREGIVYDNAFATSPVCAPARSSLITGMYATRIGTLHMRNGKPSKAAIEADPEAYRDIPSYEGLPPAFVRCFPESLRIGGYYCTNNAKKDYQFREPITVWDDSSGKAHWKNRADDQPFFAIFNHNGTHESRAFPSTKRAPSVVSPEDVPIPPFYPDTPEVRDALSRTYDNIARMDAWVGERLDELEAAGLLENTVIWFFSDHGVGLPRGKRSVYDTGSRVPLILRFPNAQAGGTRESRVVQFVDFGPTALSMAGLRPDTRLDGRAFMGLDARPGSGFAFTHADRFDAEREHTRSVSDGRFRYIRNLRTDVPYLLPVAYRERIPMTAQLYALRESKEAISPSLWQMSATERPPEEFYDSEQDPWEVDNRIDAPEYQERIAALRSALDQWMEETEDMGDVLPESDLVRERIWPPNGTQPTTALPKIARSVANQNGNDVNVVTIHCATDGASIGYRFLTAEDPLGRWRVYAGDPVVAPMDASSLLVRAHRIGFKPADIRIDLD